MYINAVDKAVQLRFQALNTMGVDIESDLGEWSVAITQLRQAFTNHDFPDLYLYRRWKVPIELGFVSDQSFDYYHDTWFKSIPSDNVSAIAWDSLRPYIEPLDAILYHLALFTGDHREKET